MKLAEKILNLRKQQGMSQEALAEKLNVSRQAVSRWEMGTAQPDASNILQLSKLFGVTADYLLNDEYESDYDVPAVKCTEKAAKEKLKKVVGACIAAAGLLGNFIIYILSRMIEVGVPAITYDPVTGEKWYRYGLITDHSYKYFIQEYDLELLAALFWGLVIAGIWIVVSDKIKEFCKKRKQQKNV